MMRAQPLLLLAAAAVPLSLAACFQGPGDTPPSHGGNGIPLVVVSAPSGLATGDILVPIEVFDAEFEPVRVWDRCPFPGASPILGIGFSTDGGNTFTPILVTDLTLDSAAMPVPTCEDVEAGAANSITSTANGTPHVVGWKTKPYVPTDARVVFRVTVSDGFNSSDPGDSEEFLVTNAPRFDVLPAGLRPGQSAIAAPLSGQLTHWANGITVTSNGAANVTLAGLAVTSTTSATLDISLGADPAQIPNVFSLVTPGAGKGGTTERSSGILWTCPAAANVIEFETSAIGDASQYLCGQGGPALHGDGNIFEAGSGAYNGDIDFYVFVATSAYSVNATLDWSSTDGAATDYDLYLTALDGSQDVVGVGCADVPKPELCSGGPLVPGTEYLLEIYSYDGQAVDYTVDLVFAP